MLCSVFHPGKDVLILNEIHFRRHSLPKLVTRCTPSLVSHRRGPYAPCVTRLSATAVPATVIPRQEQLKGDAKKEQVLQLEALPPPPRSATLLTITPYLLKLLLANRRLSWRLGASSVCVLLSKLSGLAAPVLFKEAVDALSASNIALTVQTILLSGFFRLASGTLKEIQLPLFTPVAQAAARSISSQTFAHVLDLDTQYHLDQQSGSLTKVLDRGTRSIQMTFRIIIFTFIPTVLEFCLVCGMLGRSFGPLVSLVVGLTFIGYIGWTAYLSGIAKEARMQANRYDNLTSGKAIDVLQNFETVTLFNNKNMEVSQYDEYLRSYQNASIENEKILSVLNSGQHAVLTSGLTACLVVAVMCNTGQALTTGSLVLVQGLLLQLFVPLQFLGWFYREVKQSLADLDEFFKILRTKSNLPDGHLTLPPPSLNVHTNGANGAKSMEADTMSGLHDDQASKASAGLDVTFENVVFGYSEERIVLRGIDLKIEPGKSVAIVGSSGSGKSTFLKVLARLYDIKSGSVKLDGIDVRDLQQSSLRSAIGVVPQDTVLFNDSIMENLRYGRPEASDEEVYAAARMAQLHEAILRMPQKYETIVGERGLKLSGGEKQRVAIARTFLRGPRLLLCDEATSALDTSTEQEIMSALKDLAENRTSIFIAHRLSTIQNCDTIYVMCGGKVAEQGTHQELLALGRMYYDMWTAQSKKRDGAALMSSV